jgi:cytochrome c oxidase subunit II
VGSVPSMFATHGLLADRVAQLGWVLTLISIAVTVIITTLLLIALARRRGVATSDVVADGHARAVNRWIVTGGVILPALIIAGSFVYTLRVQGAVSGPPAPPAMTIQVIGHRWWWEIRYAGSAPDEGVTTANEIHVPVGRPIRFELTTQDVIHSFWVPQLAGKTDVINGQTNVMWLEARTAGTYRGECAEYCGVQHANMDLSVTAEDSAAFDAWRAHQETPASIPQDTAARAGAQVFLEARCPACHIVRGTWTQGTEGPDLTHVASRLTLGAGLLDNNEGNLAGWVSNAPALKPGVMMPPTHLNSSQLRALLAYLETLR